MTIHNFVFGGKQATLDLPDSYENSYPRHAISYLSEIDNLKLKIRQLEQLIEEYAAEGHILNYHKLQKAMNEVVK